MTKITPDWYQNLLIRTRNVYRENFAIFEAICRSFKQLVNVDDACVHLHNHQGNPSLKKVGML